MVSLRCKMMVKDILDHLNIKFRSISLGEVDLLRSASASQLELIGTALKKSGLELMDDKKSILIQSIKNIIIEMVHYEDQLPKTKFSVYLSQKLQYNYTYLANLFSETEGITIEHFIIIHKIEKVKELIIYDELNFSEIAFQLNYSSVQHLSRQFKKVTGLTPSFFKSLKDKKRVNLENLGE